MNYLESLPVGGRVICLVLAVRHDSYLCRKSDDGGVCFDVSRGRCSEVPRSGSYIWAKKRKSGFVHVVGPL